MLSVIYVNDLDGIVGGITKLANDTEIGRVIDNVVVIPRLQRDIDVLVRADEKWQI